jgi:hypothetical protein
MGFTGHSHRKPACRCPLRPSVHQTLRLAVSLLGGQAKLWWRGSDGLKAPTMAPMPGKPESLEGSPSAPTSSIPEMRILSMVVEQVQMPYSACQTGQTVSYWVSVMLMRALRRPGHRCAPWDAARDVVLVVRKCRLEDIPPRTAVACTRQTDRLHKKANAGSTPAGLTDRQTDRQTAGSPPAGLTGQCERTSKAPEAANQMQRQRPDERKRPPIANPWSGCRPHRGAPTAQLLPQATSAPVAGSHGNAPPQPPPTWRAARPPRRRPRRPAGAGGQSNGPFFSGGMVQRSALPPRRQTSAALPRERPLARKSREAGKERGSPRAAALRA